MPIIIKNKYIYKKKKEGEAKRRLKINKEQFSMRPNGRMSSIMLISSNVVTKSDVLETLSTAVGDVLRIECSFDSLK